MALRSHLPGSVLDESTPLAGIDDTDIPAPSVLAANDAYEMAGLGPADLDVVECQDTDAARELIAWVELGLCGPGEQPGLLASGDASLGGRTPVNPSGGLLSKGEPLGASALGQVVELVRQLRGQCGSPTGRWRPHRPGAHDRSWRERLGDGPASSLTRRC